MTDGRHRIAPRHLPRYLVVQQGQGQRGGEATILRPRGSRGFSERSKGGPGRDLFLGVPLSPVRTS